MTQSEDTKAPTVTACIAKIFGYETDEVIGEPFDIIFTEEDIKSDIPKREIEKALKGGRAAGLWHKRTRKRMGRL